MTIEIADLAQRVTNIEAQKKQEVLTLIEILSNASFFGGLKQANCGYAKNGQCGYFTLKETVKQKIPITSDCRIRNCKEENLHYHIELSQIGCSLCPQQGKLPKNKKTKTDKMKSR